MLSNDGECDELDTDCEAIGETVVNTLVGTDTLDVVDMLKVIELDSCNGELDDVTVSVVNGRTLAIEDGLCEPAGLGCTEGIPVIVCV